MLASIWIPAALAIELPEFKPDQTVYVVPAQAEFARARVEQATRDAEHDIRVVVFERVIDGHIAAGRATETEDALEDLAASWRASADRTGFRPDETSIIVLGLDDREVRVLSASRWDAELGLHNDALLPVIDEYFLPLARTGDLDLALAATVGGLDARIHHERFVAPAERAAAARTRKLLAVAAGGVLAMLGVGGLLLYARADRALFFTALNEHRLALDIAERTLAELTITADSAEKVAMIKDKGERTAAVWREVTGDLDRLVIGLATLRRHIDAVAASPRASWALRAGPWRQAKATLEDGIPADPSLVKDRLFPSGADAETVSVAAFTATLEARFTAAKEGWAALCEAAELRLSPAITVLGDLGLSALRRRLAAAGLPESWLAGHPLLPSPDAALDALDAVRRADPLAFLEACVAATAKVEALAEAITALLDDRERAMAAAQDALAAPGVPEGTVVTDPAEDPASAAAPLRAAQASLEDALSAGAEFEAVDKAADALVDAAVELKRRKDQANAALTEAPAALAQAEERLASLTAQAAAAEARASGFVSQHLPKEMADAWRELAEARADIGEMRAALDKAKSSAEIHDLVGAWLGARAALREHGEAVANLDELSQVLSRLESARADAAQLAASLDSLRQRHHARLSEWSLGADVLREGDALRAQLPAMSGPMDYAALVVQLRAVNEVWSRHTESAVSREIRQQQELAAAARRVAAASSYRPSSSSSWSGGRSSFGRSSSVGRSSGGGFSSGSRSAGRSFSSGGRSAGRKF